MNHYDPKISRDKGKQGALEGALTTFIALGIMAGVKTISPDGVSPEIENAVAGVSGLIAGAVTLGVRRFLKNRKKHKK